ncbi:MAG: HEAT repeat domain-containing protein [Gemmatimonadetes bacterium]|nr:HEAT repeat domain-containing protein [Gemmatimonadota bacterium]
MTDTPPEISDATPAEGEDWAEGDDLPVAEVRSLFIVLGKALRAFQLYDQNNPVRKRFVANLRESFEELWEEVEGLNLSVEEDRILLVGEEIYQSSSRSDSLAFLLYKDGIRDITFLPGVEGPEITKILGVLQRAKMLKSAEADDLLTMLWEQDLEFFQCRSVDQITEGAVLPTAQAEEDRAGLAQVLEGEAKAAEDGAGDQAGAAEGEPPPPKIGQDFSPTLYALDPDEKVQLQRALASEMSRDLRHEVLAALFDRLEEPGYPDRKTEIIKIFRGLLPTLLSRGDVESAANILEELAAVRADPEILDEVRQKECDELLDDLSAPETLEELVRGLQDGTIDVPVEVLGRLLRFLRAGALPILLLAAEQEEMPALKETLRDAVHGIAEENPEAVLSLLEDRDPVVTSGAVRLVGRMGIAEASPKLAGLMNHPDAGVRLALIETIQLLADVTTPDTLIGALSDDDRDVRVAAAGALAELGVETAASALEALVTGKEIRQADLTEKIAIFESYGVLGGSRATDVLNEILNKKGFLGRREPSQIRASAARALGKGGLPGAHEALLAAQRDTDAVVRTAVRQALEGVGEEAE